MIKDYLYFFNLNLLMQFQSFSHYGNILIFFLLVSFIIAQIKRFQYKVRQRLKGKPIRS